MQRYNPFNQAYNTLQDVLFNNAKNLRQMVTGKQADAIAAGQQAADAVQLFEWLVQATEALFFPAADPYEPAIVDAVRQQHATAAKGAAQLLATLQKETEVFAWPHTFNGVMVQLLRCMLKGEALLLPVLWHYYSDAELKGLEEKLQAMLQPAQLLRA